MRKTFAFLLAALCAFPALADLVYTEGADWVRITDRPCPFDILLRHKVPEGQRGYYRRGSAFIQGQLYIVCWQPRAELLFVLYDDGDQGLVPIESLREDSGT